MQAGQLRRRVTVQQPAQAPDRYGQLADTWADVGTYWAFVRTPTGREAIIAQQFKAELTHVVTMRYLGSAPLGPNMRLAYKGRIFNVLDVLNVDERNRQYDVHCQEVVAVPPPSYPPAGGG